MKTKIEIKTMDYIVNVFQKFKVLMSKNNKRNKNQKNEITRGISLFLKSEPAEIF